MILSDLEPFNVKDRFKARIGVRSEVYGSKG